MPGALAGHCISYRPSHKPRPVTTQHETAKKSVPEHEDASSKACTGLKTKCVASPEKAGACAGWKEATAVKAVQGPEPSQNKETSQNKENIEPEAEMAPARTDAPEATSAGLVTDLNANSKGEAPAKNLREPPIAEDTLETPPKRRKLARPGDTSKSAAAAPAAPKQVEAPGKVVSVTTLAKPRLGPVPGDTVQVYSTSARRWCTGKVQTREDDMVVVNYTLPKDCVSEHAGKLMTKPVHISKLRYPKGKGDAANEEEFFDKIRRRTSALAENLKNLLEGETPEAVNKTTVASFCEHLQAVESRINKLYSDIDSWDGVYYQVLSRNEFQISKEAALEERLDAVNAEIARLEASRDAKIRQMNTVMQPLKKPQALSCDQGHALVLTDHIGKSYKDGKWVCDRCLKISISKRWNCRICMEDYCFDCLPKDTHIDIEETTCKLPMKDKLKALQASSQNKKTTTLKRTRAEDVDLSGKDAQAASA